MTATSDITTTTNSRSNHDMSFTRNKQTLILTATHLPAVFLTTPTPSFSSTIVITETVTRYLPPVINNDLPLPTQASYARNDIENFGTAYVKLPTPVKDVTVTRKVQVTTQHKVVSTVYIEI